MSDKDLVGLICFAMFIIKYISLLLGAFFIIIIMFVSFTPYALRVRLKFY